MTTDLTELASLRAQLAEAQADADALAKVLEKITKRVNGNEELRGCERFYKGFNAANDTCRDLARQALASRPKAARKRVEVMEVPNVQS